ncbi:MAG: SDR family oxidoreductase [Frankia sp.]|nr:SDR family oxidoreductase [Frankia sp.]
MFDLSSRVVIVTGASSGLGRQFAIALHGAGAKVVAIARRKDRLDALAAACPGLETRPVDVSDEQACERLVEDTLATHGRIDGLVNNAGVGAPAPAVSEPLERFRRTLEVNLTAVFNLSRLVAPGMIERGRGSIVNIASVFGLGSAYPLPSAAYSASKAAVINLTRDLAGQWGKRGVRVNAIAPGFFPSEMADEVFTDERANQRITLATPMRRTGGTGELDGALVYLLSDASSFVTGHTLVVDGGWSTH